MTFCDTLAIVATWTMANQSALPSVAFRWTRQSPTSYFAS